MAQFATQSVGGFLDLLAAKCPAPGGGAAACMAGATAAALAHMVMAYSIGKKNLAEHQPLLESAAAALLRARAMLLQLADEDAAAYALVNELQKLPETDARRMAEWGGAAAAAVAAPRAAMAVCMEVLRMSESLAGKSNAYLRSDLAIAAVLAEAAARSAWWNVRINLSLVADEGERSRLRAEGERACGEAAGVRERVEGQCAAS
ncbi:MAG: cyclodeaminase/cyclohydrolase family protein [Phycisphaeraceae bacterium]|nr:cyclodeaminase/cyclohydrolase family protein [Phycisphaeraceae bacterium]